MLSTFFVTFTEIAFCHLTCVTIMTIMLYNAEKDMKMRVSPRVKQRGLLFGNSPFISGICSYEKNVPPPDPAKGLSMYLIIYDKASFSDIQPRMLHLHSVVGRCSDRRATA